MKKVILTTGGTGGHIYPALSVGKELKKRDVDILFVGSKTRMESELVPQEGFRFVGLDIQPPKKSILKYLSAIWNGVKLIKKEKPDAIIGFGNYISVPAIVGGLLAGKKVKVYLQEQNANMGGVNKLFYRFVNKTFLAFNPTYDEIPLKYQHKLLVTGNPLRNEIYDINYFDEREKMKVGENEKIILITGGSLGAQEINNAVIKHWSKFEEDKNIRLYWATGKKNYEEVVSKLDKIKIQDIVRPYFENMVHIMAAADVVICRAGALTISEVIELQKPSVIIPYSSKKVGQMANAEVLEDIGAGFVFTNSKVSKGIEKAFEILDNQKEQEEMRINLKSLKHKDPAKQIADNIDIWRK